MTILYHIASTTWGGGEQYVFDLASAMRLHNNRCLFALPDKCDPMLIERFRTIGNTYIIKSLSSLKRFLPLTGKDIAQIIDSENVDILHLNSRQAYFAAAWAKHFAHRHFKLVATQHLVRTAKNTIAWRWAYRHIDTLICVSEIVKRTYYNPAFKQQVIIRNSIRLEPDYSAHTIHDIDTPIILYHGRVCREKGINNLIAAIKMINRPLILRIVGAIDPRYNNELQDIIKGTEHQVELWGFRQDIPNLICQATIGVIPSIVPEAGGPLALIENLAYGLPTITTDNGSQAELITHMQNGLLYHPDDIESLTGHINTLLDNPELRHQLALNGQAFYSQYLQFNSIIKQYESIYSQI